MSDRKQIFILLPTISPRTGLELDLTLIESHFDSIDCIRAWELVDSFRNIKIYLTHELESTNQFLWNNFYNVPYLWEPS